MTGMIVEGRRKIEGRYKWRDPGGARAVPRGPSSVPAGCTARAVTIIEAREEGGVGREAV